MDTIATIGLDLAKNVFQVHCVDGVGNVVIKRQLPRSEVLKFFAKVPACLVGMEACGTAHHWGRELLELGHNVMLMPPAYVKLYVKGGKTDAADAEAIAEAVTRPTMRFVAVKSVEQQAVLMLHKARDLLVRQKTMLINALRAHLAEFGIVAARGPGGVNTVFDILHTMQDYLSNAAARALNGLADQLHGIRIEIDKINRD
jgi:transposase